MYSQKLVKFSLGKCHRRNFSRQSYRTHNCGELRATDIGQKVKIAGWLQAPRVSHSRIVPQFIPIQDMYGVTQAISKTPKIKSLVQKTPFESIVSVEGLVIARKSPNLTNPTGQIEIVTEHFEVLNRSDNLSYNSLKEYYLKKDKISNEHRHVFLRRPENLKILIKRSKFIHTLSHYLHTERGFIEVDTPVLTKKTPEGSKEFIVPSADIPHHFYTLAQSPQQFKQLLMVSSIDRYFQVAKCFRDEDHSGKKNIEFSQLDLEMAFVTQTDVMNLIEDLVCEAIAKIFPDHSLLQTPFPKLTYHEAMSKYGTDKPDIRGVKDLEKLAFAWIYDFPLFKQTNTGELKSEHHPFTSPHPEDAELIYTDPLNARGQSFDLVLNGVEIGGGSIRIHQPPIQRYVLEEVLKTDINELMHLISALGDGCPPHGGFALGLDRMLMNLLGQSNTNDVIAFPKSCTGRDNTINSPSKLTADEIAEYGLNFTS